MLQKILVILVGLFMSIVGAFGPSGSLFASHPAASPGLSLNADAHDATLATVRTSDGSAFAKVSVLWVEADGRRVTDDAWGTGEIQELKFKVGTKDLDGLALAVGDRVVALHPTDVLTVRTFKGEFAYRGMAGSAATLALQGTVKTALVSQGDVTQRIQTQATGIPATAPRDAPADGKLAYVVLDTGERLDTVAVESSGGRLYTQEESSASAPAPGNLLARYVKIDGRLVKDYTAGDGTLATVEFEPALAASTSGRVAFNGEDANVPSGTKVVVKDFVGEYLVYQVSDGLVRLRLDGYAASFTTGGAAPPTSPAAILAGLPNVAFDYAPLAPRTSDAVQFHDRSSDDGYVVFRQWDFGDGQTSILAEPTHRYALPGVYEVTLNVTDNDLQQREMRLTLSVRNSDPTPDFDFAPKLVTAESLVTFSDLSADIDGSLANWTWDFGDGAHAYARNPTHQFAKPGNYSVTLTATDNLGGVKGLSKLVTVRDLPPLARFDVAPAELDTLVPVQFVDRSLDKDGAVVAWQWSFGDGTFGSGSAPTHAYQKPGLFTVVLTVTDDHGVSSTLSQNIVLRNRPPVAQFTWGPSDATAGVPVTFTSTSHDADGVILLTTWDFGDGSSTNMGANVVHAFPRWGTYNVTIHVTDGLAESTLTRSIAIDNTAPRASLQATPNPTFRGTTVLFADATTDVDGDAITSRLWTFGDGNTSTLAFPNNTYYALGEYPVTLQVTDAQGKMGWANTTLKVLNRPPIGSVHVEPAFPVAGQPIWFNASGVDPDDPLLARGPLTYEWRFSDGVNRPDQNTNRTFAEAGTYRGTLLVHDAEGGVSIPAFATVIVTVPPPVAAFAYAPSVPLEKQAVQFTDLSTTLDAGGLTSWTWTFGDGVSSTARNPTHAYDVHGVYVAKLTVTDAKGSNSTTQSILVNGPPTASFEVSPLGALPTGSTVTFTDASTDPEQEALLHNWTFGDGGTSTATSPTHTYTLPGTHTVKLSVTDSHGATSETTKVVVIQDRAPTAGFVVSPLSPTAGQSVNFEGQGYSHDPDGDATIVGYEWTFGDSGNASGHAASHVYANSGVYTVSLVVSDGVVRSAPASKALRVGSDHPVTVRICANLPPGRVANLADSHYHLAALFAPTGANPQTYAKGDLALVGSCYDLLVQTGAWVAGDPVTVSLLDDRWMSTPASKLLTLADADGRNGPVTLTFDLAMPLVPTLRAQPGDGYVNVTGQGVPVFPNATTTAQGDPIYRSPFERFHGDGTVLFVDGVPAAGANVVLEARWLPIPLVGAARDAQVAGRALVPDNFAVGWCRAGQAVVNATGGYSWSFLGTDCLPGTLPTQVFPLGVWEVRARAVLGYATVGVTPDPQQRIVVDPTGGALPYGLSLPP